MPTKTKARRSQRVIRSFKHSKATKDFVNGNTRIHYFNPEISHGSIGEAGLDSEINLGKSDLEKLGYPERIKVVIYSLDD
jgi:hypothetical protein